MLQKPANLFLDDEWFCGITREEQELRKKELLSTQAESLLMYGPMLSEHSFRCIVGSIDLLPEEERESWKLI